MTWANQVRILTQNLQQLASVVGGTLINALKPLVKALNAAMSNIIAFVQTVSNALGKIFGWTYESGGGGIATDFEDAAESADNIAGSTGKAADNIKKMKAGLRAFDELKTINISDAGASTSGAGTGTSTAGASSDNGQWTQAESILKAFESDIDSLYELGAKINEALSKTLENINWNSIYEKARNFGTGLASFLNGLLDDPALFANLGNTIAGAINTALNASDAFSGKFHFYNLGVDIGTAVNSALSGIDWNTALSSAKNWGEGIGNTITGFLKTTDFSLVGSTIANGLNTAVQFALSLGTSIDFSEFGLKISDGINGFFETFDFAKLAKTLNVWVDGIKESIITAISNVKWEDVFKGIKDFLSDLELDTVITLSFLIAPIAISSLSKLLLKISNVVTAIGILKNGLVTLGTNLSILANGGLLTTTGLFSKLANVIALTAGGAGTLSEAFTAIFGTVATTITGIASIAAGALTNILSFVSMINNGFSWLKEALLVVGAALAAIGAVLLGAPAAVAAAVAGIVVAVETAVVLIKDNWGTIKQFFIDVWEGIKEVWGKVADWFDEHVIEPVVKFFKGLWDDVKSIFTSLWNDIVSIWKNVSGWFNNNVINPVVSFFKGFYKRVKQVFEGLWIIVQAIWKVVSGWFNSNVIQPIVTLFEKMKNKIGGFFSNLWNNIKSLWKSASSWFTNNVTNPIVNVFNSVKEKVSNLFSNLWNGIKSVWQPVANWFNNNVIDPVKNAWETAVNAIGGFFDSLWTSIKSGVANAFNAVLGGIETAINWIVGGINKIIKGFNKVVSWAAKVAEVDWGGVDTVPEVHFSRIPAYATGGFPEDGWFRASHGEIMGKFDNGKSVVANNEQITQGIADAVYPAVYNAVSAAMKNNNGSNVTFSVEGDPNGIFKVTQKKANEYYRRTGNPAFEF